MRETSGPQLPITVGDVAITVRDIQTISDTDCAPLADHVDLEIIVPTFNEQSRIGSTLESLVHQISEMHISSQLRVIDNGSTDRTPDIVDRVRSAHPQARISLEGCSRQGKGGAVARGMLTSRAQWVGFCDADLATPASAIVDAVRYLEEGWPVVIGSRHMLGARRIVDQPLWRRIGGTGFRLLSRSLTGDLELADTQCGFKFFDGSAARAIFSKTTSTGFAFDVEVLARARGLGYGVKEFPVEWTDRDGSTFHVVKHGAEVTRDLWRLRQGRQRLTRASR